MRDTPMSCEILRDLAEKHLLPVDELADLLNISRSHAYRYLTECELEFSQLRTVMRHAKKRAEIQDHFARSIFSGLGRALIFVDGPAEDADIDTDQAIERGIAANNEMAGYLSELHDAVKDSQISDDELERLNELSRSLIADLMAAQRAIEILNDLSHRRKKCRPLVVTE